MKLSEIFELISYEVVLATLGTVFAIGLLWSIFFGGGINPILELLVEKLG